MKYLLPRGHLSHSSMDLWEKSKPRFRLQQYLGEGYVDSAAMRFGRKIHKMIEEGHDSVSHIPHYDTAERRILADIEGVKVLGYIDDFNSKTLQSRDYKTGKRTPKGKCPWDLVKVRKTPQLPLYALLIDIDAGRSINTHSESGIVWIETEPKPEKKGIGNVGGELRLTGEFEEFPRIIKPFEKQNQIDRVKRIAKEVTEDYKKWLSENI